MFSMSVFGGRKVATESPPANSTDTVPRVQRLSDYLVVGLFLIALTVPLIRFAQPGTEQAIEETEKRHAARFPRLEFRRMGLLARPTTSSIRLYPSRFEDWFNDRAGGRRQLIQLYNLAKICGVTTSDLGRAAAGGARQSNVIVGREGWLFCGNSEQVNYYRCTRPFDAEQLNSWRTTLESRRDWLARRGIQYLVYIVPSPHNVNSEFLPRAITRSGAPSRLDQLLTVLDHPGGITVLDGRKRMLKAKSQFPPYHKTDTHWNEFGAFIGYSQICEQLCQWFPKLQPRRLDQFDVRISDAPGMELTKAIDSPFAFREQLVTLTPHEPRTANIVDLPQRSDGITYVRSTHPGGELSAAVILHDSYMVALRPYTSEHFQRAHYVWTHDFPIDVIDAERPCVVIQELVEWKLADYQPKNPAELLQPTSADGPTELLAMPAAASNTNPPSIRR